IFSNEHACLVIRDAASRCIAGRALLLANVPSRYISAMTILEAILQRFRDRIMRMRTAFIRFNDESAEREKVGPKWNVRDLCGHYLFWTTEAVDRLPDISKASAAFKQTDDAAA